MTFTEAFWLVMYWVIAYWAIGFLFFIAGIAIGFLTFSVMDGIKRRKYLKSLKDRCCE